MTASLKEVEDSALKLSPCDRGALVETLISSLEGNHEAPAEEVTAAWNAEIERRVAEMDAGSVEYTDADDAMRALRQYIKTRRHA